LPLFALDKIMINEGFNLLASGVHDVPLARAASDHLPVWARLGVTDAKAGATGSGLPRAARPARRETPATG
jgi:hypothetical protein